MNRVKLIHTTNFHDTEVSVQFGLMWRRIELGFDLAEQYVPGLGSWSLPKGSGARGCSARVMGHSIRSDPTGVKSVLGVVPQEIALYEDMTARENMVFWGKMYGLRGRALKARVDEVLDVIGLRERAGERVGKYSGGMKRRVNIGVALLHKPKVIYGVRTEQV